ncbi:lysophospholipid acyltransferase family protein [Halothiobacillus sp. DCM-1]|uniref:lysophospholipid acyltransferase family protein n=1 Tax=Halothiobacillus sp. DCM-1 TaxID=3112558 RepID=UPI00324E4BB2
MSRGESAPQGATQPFSWAFLCPRYGFVWLLFGLLWLLAYAPHRLRLGVAWGVAALYRRLYSKRRRIVATNLALCFPQQPDAVRAAWLRRHFLLQAYALLDLGRLWFRSPGYLQRQTTVSDPLLFDQLVAQGGVVLTGHGAGLEWVGHYFTMRMTGSAMYKPFGKNRLLNWLFERGRERHGARVYPRHMGLKPHLKHLRAGQGFFYIADEDLGEAHSVFAPFFGVEKATIPLAGKIAAVSRAMIYPALGQLDLRTGRYQLLIHAPVSVPPNDDRAAAGAINQALEALIALDPPQYMWSLKLFKTATPDRPDPYR